MLVLFEFVSSHPMVVLVAGVFGLVGLWQLWRFRLKPLFIPKADIDRMVDALIAEHGERAEDVAMMEEDRAWRRSEALKQGIWRRVRRELWRRYEAGEWE
ncbi:MAG: hypothetical protein AAF739_04965 [Pseudomonadota bacterium]